MAQEVLLKLEHVKRYFKLDRKTTVKAVDDVSFEIYQGETFSLVGESGSGKSTLGRTVINLYKPTDGEITFDGVLTSGKLSAHQQKQMRTEMQMIFQDPMASLNPRKKVLDIVSQGIDVNHLAHSAAERREMVVNILNKVGLPESYLNRYPHQFSGGQRQRIGIARAMVMQPKFVIADEPISALDVSIQAQVINLLKELQHDMGITYLFIAHDLSVVKHISDRVGVMHLGHLVELGTVQDVFEHPQHPYTKSLLTASPQANPRLEKVRKRETYQAEATSYTAAVWTKLSDSHYVLK